MSTFAARAFAPSDGYSSGWARTTQDKFESKFPQGGLLRSNGRGLEFWSGKTVYYVYYANKRAPGGLGTGLTYMAIDTASKFGSRSGGKWGPSAEAYFNRKYVPIPSDDELAWLEGA